MKKLAILALLAVTLGLAANAQASGPAQNVVLTWTYTQGATPATGFNVYRCAGASCTPSTLINSTLIPATTLTYTDTTTAVGTTYGYFITAVAANGAQSAPSNTFTLGAPATPGSLSGTVTVTIAATGSVTVTTTNGAQ